MDLLMEVLHLVYSGGNLFPFSTGNYFFIFFSLLCVSVKDCSILLRTDVCCRCFLPLPLIPYVLFAELPGTTNTLCPAVLQQISFHLQCFPTQMLKTCFIAAKLNQLEIHLCASLQYRSINFCSKYTKLQKIEIVNRLFM